jgi:hypothetical protein
MLKKIIGFSLVVMSVVFAVPVLAEEAVNTNTTVGGSLSVSAVAPSTTADKIACVKAAVAVREAALALALGKHSESVGAAYATRANVLAGAYSNTTKIAVRAGVKVAWADFSKSVKSANETWKASRRSAWSAFKTSTKACKMTDVSDSGNSGIELSM